MRSKIYRGIEKQLSRNFHKVEIGGANPPSATTY